MVLTCGAVAAALAWAATPAGAGPPARHLDASAAAGAKAPGGLVFGGITSASWPVVVALNRTRTRVENVVIGLDLSCSSGDSFGTSDGYQALKISKGRFHKAFGPQRIDAGGVPADIESRVVGRFNKGRGSVRGIWSLKITLYDAAGTNVTDTCESGLVNWTAAQ
jgi:hypothetical protein